MIIKEWKYVEKPWGSERILADEPEYVGKILYIGSGHRISKQYHKFKKETMILLKGKADLYIYSVDDEGDTIIESFNMEYGKSYTILPMTIHRVSANTDAEIFEASTPHLDDVVRLDDIYGRN